MKIVVVGSGGRLGGALSRILGERHEVIGFDRAALDLADSQAIESSIRPLDFDVLLSPAALTSVDYCEQNPAEASAVNAAAPGLMAKIAAEKGARMIHFSTDYVFDGRGAGLRQEDDPVAPLGAYGRSKAAGEQAVLAVSPGFLVARVCWLFGRDRPSFLDSIIWRSMADEGIAAIADKVSTPSSTDDVSRMVETLLHRPEIGGLIHLCNSGACSWQEYGQAGLDAAAAAGIPLKTRTLAPMRLEDIGFDAPRPRFTGLSNERFAGIAGGAPRPWEEAVAEYVTRNADRLRAGATA